MPNNMLRVIAKLDGDAMAAGSAVGFGVHLQIMSDVEVIVSIVAGFLVACSAGLSLWLNWRQYKKDKAAEKAKSGKPE